MKLCLQNGYIIGADVPNDENQDPVHEYIGPVIEGVKHFEIKFEVTLEFRTKETYDKAKELTGWDEYDPVRYILSAKTNRHEGYEHVSALVTNNIAWAGFYLMDDN